MNANSHAPETTADLVRAACVDLTDALCDIRAGCATGDLGQILRDAEAARRKVELLLEGLKDLPR